MVPNGSAVRAHKSRNWRKSAFIFAFLLPGIFLFLAIYAYPLVNIFVTSFTSWNFENLLHPEFLGWDHLFDNYIRRLQLIPILKWRWSIH